jgi:competence protein ComEA
MSMLKNKCLGTAVIATLLMIATLPGAAFAASGKVNVNTASAAQLQLLPRVGPAVAQRILDYRKANGSFKTTDDLMLVRGIGEATYKRLKPYVSTSGETTLKDKVHLRRGNAEDQ